MRVRKTVPDDLDELVEVERLQDRVAHGRGRDFVDAAFAGGGKDDDVRAMMRILLADLLDELVSIKTRHHEIEENEVEPAILLHLLQPHRPILGQLDIELHAAEDGLQKDTNSEVIVDDQNSAARAVDLPYSHPTLIGKFFNAKQIPS